MPRNRGLAMFERSVISLQGACIACFLAAISVAHAQDGLYDELFGNYLPGRTVYHPLESASDGAYAMAVLPDGRLILASTDSVIRLDASGVPDPSFGSSAFGVPGMLAIRPFEDSDDYLTPAAVVHQADGKLLFAGWAKGADSRYHYAVCRTSADGLLDPNYGDDGCATAVVESGRDEFGTAAALDSQGRLILGGTGRFSFGQKMVVLRFLADGRLDSHFGSDGSTVLLRFGEIQGATTEDSLAAITLDTEGRILIAGYITPPAPAGDNFAIARLNAEGLLDASFGDSGARVVDIAGQELYDQARSIAIQRNGRIIVAGNAEYPGAEAYGMAVLGLTPSGEIDTSFGSAPGLFMAWAYDLSSYTNCFGVTIQQDGKIVLAGSSLNPHDDFWAGVDLAVVRLTANGNAYDATFATSGIFTGGIDLGTGEYFTRNDTLTAVGLQANRIVAVGYANSSSQDSSFLTIRLTQNALFAGGFELP